MIGETDSAGNVRKKCDWCGIETYGPLYPIGDQNICSSCDNGRILFQDDARRLQELTDMMMKTKGIRRAQET